MSKFTPILSIFLISLLPKFVSGQENAGLKDQFLLTGAISNAKESFITITSHSFSKRQIQTIDLDSDGQFSAYIPIKHEHDFTINYGKQSLKFIAKAGDRIELTSTGDNFKEKYSFHGNNDSLNNNINVFLLEFTNRFHESGIRKGLFHGDLEIFKSRIKNFQFSTQELIDSMSNQSKTDWMRSYTKYYVYGLIKDFVKVHNLNVGESFFTEFDSSFLERNLADLKCSEYYSSFARAYYWGFLLPKHEDYKKLLALEEEGKWEESYTLYSTILADMVNSDMDSELHMFLFLHRWYHEEPDLALPIIREHAFSGTVDFKSFIQNENPAGINEIMSISDLNGEAALLFDSIKQMHPNQAIYIDIWGPWCKPCIKEFAHMKDLRASNQLNNIAFVYLCYDASPESWQNSISKYNLDGSHFLIDNKQYQSLAKQIGLIGLPWYILLDQQGQFIDMNAKRPSQNGLKEQLLEQAN